MYFQEQSSAVYILNAHLLSFWYFDKVHLSTPVVIGRGKAGASGWTNFQVRLTVTCYDFPTDKRRRPFAVILSHTANHFSNINRQTTKSTEIPTGYTIVPLTSKSSSTIKTRTGFHCEPHSGQARTITHFVKSSWHCQKKCQGTAASCCTGSRPPPTTNDRRPTKSGL